MVALYAVSKSSARSRSDGDDMIQYGRSGREGSGAREGLGGGDREIEIRRRTRRTSRSKLWLALASGVAFGTLASCSIAACEYTWYASKSAAFVPRAACLALTVINHVNFHKKSYSPYSRK